MILVKENKFTHQTGQRFCLIFESTLYQAQMIPCTQLLMGLFMPCQLNTKKVKNTKETKEIYSRNPSKNFTIAKAGLRIMIQKFMKTQEDMKT